MSLGHAQKLEPDVIKARIESYKNDVRGPYKDIRWFCKDGKTQGAKEPCAKPGGVQRARMKDDVLALAKSNHIFLGQILATTDHSEFWDIQNGNSRLKQYQLEKYLRAIDDGWVLRKGQYYRGAFQAEDEEAWGIEFYKWLLADDTRLQSQYFLIRQSIRDIPHRGDDSKTLQIRAVSKTISDAYTPFMDLRVKIHGQPQASDIVKVISFRELHRAKLSQDLLTKFETLISDMRTVYEVRDLESLRPLLKAIPKEHELSLSLSALIDTYTTLSSAMSR
jgi:hypothetical protein